MPRALRTEPTPARRWLRRLLHVLFARRLMTRTLQFEGNPSVIMTLINKSQSLTRILLSALADLPSVSRASASSWPLAAILLLGRMRLLL
jgi:hypothetical protein